MDPRILRESLETVLAMDDKFPRRFYEILFERHPQVSSLFVRSSAGAQQKMFAQKLCAIVDHVEDAEWMTRELERMRVAHDEYGVTAEMFPWVGDALLDTLREALGSGFTAEVEQSWRVAYARLTSTLLKER
ncbi:MAG: hypothetical protein BGO98_07285 [Myxococcales bacterium 68-20]|nr:MAG: hypothetical protein BGO98_07285 [Myxococcales bacterium 68-20]